MTQEGDELDFREPKIASFGPNRVFQFAEVLVCNGTSAPRLGNPCLSLLQGTTVKCLISLKQCPSSLDATVYILR